MEKARITRKLKKWRLLTSNEFWESYYDLLKLLDQEEDERDKRYWRSDGRWTRRDQVNRKIAKFWLKELQRIGEAKLRRRYGYLRRMPAGRLSSSNQPRKPAPKPRSGQKQENRVYHEERKESTKDDIDAIYRPLNKIQCKASLALIAALAPHPKPETLSSKRPRSKREGDGKIVRSQPIRKTGKEAKNGT